MTSFVLKLLIIPCVLVLSMLLLPNVDYPWFWEPLILGVALAVVGVIMEYFILKKGRFWLSIAIDFGASVLFIYLVSNLLPDARVTFFGAVLISIILTIIEIFIHRHLLTSGKAQNAPA
ncbi:DUF2512 family protein [Salsuginibacillus kocurii]|uniref:DUF2512 family protein n=1 Tax=Salsuginibacillus kocurii TaxID=427078 RepID=UPI000366D492|nr:DUF2512 family protein [Salsuginibacillus kocurii]